MRVRQGNTTAKISFTLTVESQSHAQREALDRALHVARLVQDLPGTIDLHRATVDGPLAWDTFVGDDHHRNVAIAPHVKGMGALSEERMGGLSTLVDDLALRFGRGSMKHVHLVSIMHLFPTSPALFGALEKIGIPRENMQLSGKSYSTHVNASEGLRATGRLVDDAGDPGGTGSAGDAADVLKDTAARLLGQTFAGFDPERGYFLEDVGIDIIHQHMAKILGARSQVDMQVQRGKPPVFLLLDEGGMLLQALHEHFPAFAKHCVAVEHTDRGMQILDSWQDKTPLACPLVDMARSPVKKDVEGPLIGESVAFHLERQLAGVFADPARADVAGKTVVVVGYGAVGEATAKSLQARGATVVVVDIDDASRARAAAAGFATPAKYVALTAADIVIGCTGRQSVGPDDLELLPAGCVLVNAASGNHELALGALRASTTTTPTTGTLNGTAVTLHSAGQDPTFAHQVLTTSTGNEVLALRGGYVVNMVYGMPPEWVQLTLGLDVVSCVQAVKAHGAGPGVVALDDGLQDLVVRHVDADLHAAGLSLTTPDFRAVAGW